jgi:hypothetical protein
MRLRNELKIDYPVELFLVNHHMEWMLFLVEQIYNVDTRFPIGNEVPIVYIKLQFLCIFQGINLSQHSQAVLILNLLK